MIADRQKHIIVVEAYQGTLEFLSDEPEELAAAQGLGLPMEEIAEQLDCRITVLCWDDWLRGELLKKSPFTWVPKPATRPVVPRPFQETASAFNHPRVRRIPIPARDPAFGQPFPEQGYSPQAYGLIANNDLLFFVSYCLRQELTAFASREPFDAVILPMWGGLGYLAQLARATGVEPSLDVPFVVVVTDTSSRRQAANQEGRWSLEATIRRQMEDVSLALADDAFAFGLRGVSIITEGRLPESVPAAVVPRRVAEPVIDRIAAAADRSFESSGTVAFFLYEPQQPASGVLAALDAAAALNRQGIRLDRPIVSAGPPMVFAPMTPRDFRGYWVSRGFVRELLRRDQWRWRPDRPAMEGAFPVRLYPSLFEHLPDVWTELARGSLVILSPAAAEGLAPEEALPREVLLEKEPTPEDLAVALRTLLSLDPQRLDRIRQQLCRQVVAAHRGEGRKKRLKEMAARLDRLLRTPPRPQDLARVGLLFLDRRRSLYTLASEAAAPRVGSARNTLSVVVTCYEMGPMLKEAVESVWSSGRIPDELLLIDDGSQGEETLQAIRDLEAAAAARRRPLRVLRQDNAGLAGARNTGLGAASGEFISFLDGDDRIDGRFYDLALNLFERYPGLGGVAAWAYCFSERGVTGFWNAPQPELPLLLVENGVIVPCVARTEFLRGLSGYDATQRYNYEDWELSIRILASGRPIITIPTYLQDYRERTDSLYRTMTEIQNQVMRERLFETHRPLAARFGAEVGMLLENRLMRRVYADSRRRFLPPFIRRLKEMVRSALGKTS